MIRLTVRSNWGAYNAISLATIGSDGNFIDKSVKVSIQDDMLRAYNDAASGSSLGYIDSVTDYARFMSRGAQNGGFTHDDLCARSSDNNLFALGDMDFSITELGTGTDSSGNTITTTRPVADIRAARSKDYVSSRFRVVLPSMIMPTLPAAIIRMTAVTWVMRLCMSTKVISGFGYRAQCRYHA